MCHSPAENFKILGRRMNLSQGKNPSARIGIATTIVKCRTCGLIFSNPQPRPANISDHYGLPAEEYWKEEQQAINPEGIKAVVEKAEKYCGNKNGRVLDVGSGMGHQLKSLLDAGFDAYGLEPSEPFHRYAVQTTGIPAARLKMESVEDASYEEGFFDYIILKVVLEHFYDPSATLSNISKWLKPGGKIEIEVPSADWTINKLFNLFYQLQFKDYVANLSPMHPPYHLFEFSLESFRRNGAFNGLKIHHHHYYVAQTYLPGLFDKFFSWYMEKNNSGMQLIVVLEKA